jgi:hypothetical protein
VLDGFQRRASNDLLMRSEWLRELGATIQHMVAETMAAPSSSMVSFDFLRRHHGLPADTGTAAMKGSS